MLTLSLFASEERAHHEKQYEELCYRVWYCIIISQITFSGIIVELIWSYNSRNFFFWLQVYSVYSMYTCLCAIVHNKLEAYIPLGMILASMALSWSMRILTVMFMQN